MTQFSLDSIAALRRAPDESSAVRPRRDAVTLLTIYMFLLMAIPSAYKFAPLGGAGAPANVFAAAVFVWYLIMWFNPRRFHLDTSPQRVRAATLAFGCVIIAAYVSANLHALSTLNKNGVDRSLITILGFLGLVFLAVDGIDNFQRLNALIRRIVIGATGMAVVGIIQFASGVNFANYIVIPGLVQQVAFTDLLTRNGINRPSATATHPLEFAAVLAIALPLAIHQARFAPTGLRRRRWIQVALIAATMPLTVSRTAILGMAVVFAVILPVWPKRDRRVVYGLLGLSIIFLFAAVPSLVHTFTNLFGTIGGESSSDSRLAAFSYAAPIIAHHPWLGVGFGAFDPQHNFYTDDQYLLELISAGFLGLLSLIALFLAGWSGARKVRSLTADAEVRHLAQCLAASVAAAATSFATFDALSFSIAAGLTFVILGLVGATHKLVIRAQVNAHLGAEFKLKAQCPSRIMR